MRILTIIFILSIISFSCQSKDQKIELAQLIKKYEGLSLNQEERHWNFIGKGISNMVIHELFLKGHKHPESLGLKIKSWINFSEVKALKIDLQIDQNPSYPYLILISEKEGMEIYIKEKAIPQQIIDSTEQHIQNFGIGPGGKKGYKGKITIYYSNQWLESNLKRIKREFILKDKK